MNTKFFEWVARCCEILGKPKEYGSNMMPEEDPCWFGAYDDGLTPEEAVEEYINAKGKFS